MNVYSYKCLQYEGISIDYLINQHGFESLFQDYNCILFPSLDFGSIAYSLLDVILNLSSKEESEERQLTLKPLTKIILDSSKPIFQEIVQSFYVSDIIFSAYRFGHDQELYFDLIFGFSLLIMIFTELQLSSIFCELEYFLNIEDKPDILNHILCTFLARYKPEYIYKVIKENN